MVRFATPIVLLVSMVMAAALFLRGGPAQGGGEGGIYSLPDLTITNMRVELETGGSCAFTSTQLGLRVEFANVGAGAAGPFVVDANGVQQTFPGLGAGDSGSLWFASYVYNSNTVTIDALGQVAESDETNNEHTKSPPVPTLPATCTPTPTGTPLVGGHTIAGHVCEFPLPFCGALRGATITLQPLGRTAQSTIADGSFQFQGVPDGAYTLTISLCTPFGCYKPVPVTVGGADVIGVTIAPNAIATPTPTPTVTPAPTPVPTPTPRRGDANCDGGVNSIDAALVLQYGAGLLGALPCRSAADANHDGSVNTIDAALILQYVAGLIPWL